MPIFVKAGSIIPFGPAMQYIEDANVRDRLGQQG
jgi:alpha-glucosidase (family GH31 glycosyl hydrolase)